MGSDFDESEFYPAKEMGIYFCEMQALQLLQIEIHEIVSF